ncbi:TolC family protein [Ascidiimonas aurantiaca]|uniref:TolC family protein n=1 Tax=Ascidiimonas aurantiaca TaxID=1685432 RepID=UPI0030EBFCB2
MQRRIRACIFGMVCLLPAFLTAQEMLTRQTAINEVLESNLGIKIARNNVAIAENNAGILNSGYLPSVSGNAGGSIDRQNTEGVLANGDSRAAEGVETRRYNASVDVQYTLFDGLGRLYDYRALKEQEDLSELEARETIETTVLQLFTVYYEVARLEENATNLKQTLAISKDRYLRAQYQAEYGQNTGLDLLNAQVDVNTDSINLLNTTQQLNNTKRDLNLILNKNLDRSFVVDTTVQFVPNLLMEDLYATAKENNVNMQQLEKNLEINMLAVRSGYSNFLPTVGLTGSYGWNEVNNNNPLAFVIQNTVSGLSGGINLTWNLFDGGSSITNVKNARIAYENMELQKKQTEMEVERDIKNAWETYRNALFVYRAQRENVAVNRDNFNRTEERYKIGQANSLEFRQAQLNLLNAIIAKNQAKYTAKVAELQMLQVSGQLLNVDF